MSAFDRRADAGARRHHGAWCGCSRAGDSSGAVFPRTAVPRHEYSETEETMVVTGMKQMWIGGQWASAVAGGTRQLINPTTGAVLATVPEASAEDVRVAVGAAR